MPETTREWRRLAPGARLQRWWETGIAEAPHLPLLAVQGVDPGPVVLVTGGVHGDEYEGPAAIQMVFREMDATKLRGLFVGIPVVNVAAYQARSRTTPEDGVDLNRVFQSQDAAGNSTQRLAHVVFDTFVQHCDALLDLHSGGVRLVHLPLSGWYGDDPHAEQLARTVGAPFYPWRPAHRAGVLSYEAFRAGKVAIGMEWGGGASLDQTGMAAYVTAIRSVLEGMAHGPAVAQQLDMRTPIAGDYQATDQGGMFVADVRLGDHVAAGARLGLLYDELGQQVAVVEAQQAGLVAGLAHLAMVEAGDRIVYIG